MLASVGCFHLHVPTDSFTFVTLRESTCSLFRPFNYIALSAFQVRLWSVQH